MTEPSAEFQRIVAAMPENFNIESDDVATVRAKMKPWHGHPVADNTQVNYSKVGDMSMAWLRVAECNSATRYALLCHGGGFVSCSADDYLFYAEYISRYLNCEVAVPDYRLAPEHPYPAALDDCLAAYQAMLAKGIESTSILFTGDSCGGGLAASTLLRARDLKLPMPACLLGLTGWFDLQLADVNDANGRTEPMITPGWFRQRVRDYLGELEPTLPHASPVFADCTGLPPMLLQVGSNDLTLSGSKRLVKNALQANIHAELEVIPGMVHGFHGLVSSDVPESLAAWQAARRFVDKFLPEG
ncbi:MAG: alpha/beta hydrolase [Pseudomonadales bacterium]